MTVFGGIGRQGPHTNSGWLALMVAMGCLPTGTLTLALAIAKLIGDRKRHRLRERGPSCPQSCICYSHPSNPQLNWSK